MMMTEGGRATADCLTRGGGGVMVQLIYWKWTRVPNH